MKIGFVLLAILIAGIIGGLINKFRDKDLASKYWKSIIKGIGAAIIVPLFLELVKSDIVSKESESWYNYFIFGGLCIIFAIFSDSFFESISKKLMNQVETLNNRVNEIQENTEEKDIPEEKILKNLKSNKRTDLDDDIKKVTNSIINSKFSYRTISGIAKETNLDQEKIIDVLGILKTNGIAESKKNKKGNEIWKINLND
jgi:hypothetical protein